MAPVENKQYEIGAKANFGDTTLTAALFDLKRASDVYSPNADGSYTFDEDGQVEHKGLEVSLTGKVTPKLSLFGGFTAMYTKITKYPAIPSRVGNKSAIADRLAKLYAEYEVSAVPGLTLTGGFSHVGSSYADDANLDRLPSYTIGYLGARYQTRIAGHESIFRLNVDNVSNKTYWESGGYVGSPRAILFSGQVKF
jgi:iron complex outermembrane receptor protein